MSTPLNDDEYERLDHLLSTLGPQAMDVAGVEGLLTALVAGPADPSPATWLPLTWGGAAGNAEAEALVLRHHAYMQ